MCLGKTLIIKLLDTVSRNRKINMESGIKVILFCILIQITTITCFQCPGYTIPKKFQCDGINNCGDNSDEEDCPNTGTLYNIFCDFYRDLALRSRVLVFGNREKKKENEEDKNLSKPLDI